MSIEPSELPPRTAIDLGLLQEINRLLLHPAGLHLEIILNEQHDTMRILDYRDDPSGVVYRDLSSDDAKLKALCVQSLMEQKREQRLQSYSWDVQPLGSTTTH